LIDLQFSSSLNQVLVCSLIVDKSVYDPSLSGPRYFYSQDKNGLPLDRVSTVIGGVNHFCTVTPTNILDVNDWVGRKLPVGFKGRRWPPNKVETSLESLAYTKHASPAAPPTSRVRAATKPRPTSSMTSGLKTRPFRPFRTEASGFLHEIRSQPQLLSETAPAR
jgi:hypothetical protein